MSGRARSNLCVRESGDGHPGDPAVLQVPVAGRSKDLVQEIHPFKVMALDLDDVRGQRE